MTHRRVEMRSACGPTESVSVVHVKITLHVLELQGTCGLWMARSGSSRYTQRTGSFMHPLRRGQMIFQ